MIDILLKQLKLSGIESVIYSEQAMERYVVPIYGNDNVKIINDVRSATFYAYGQSKMQNRPVLLVIDESYVSSCYTALTEAWFQRIPIVVLAYNSSEYQSTLYLERCVDRIFFVNGKEQVEEAVSYVIGCKGPSLLKLKNEVDGGKVDYMDIIESIRQFDGSTKICCYNSSIFDSDKVINIDSKYKYGIFSKYIGNLIGGDNYVLCVTDEILNIESNVFNLRCFPKNFRVIVKQYDKTSKERFSEWISNNGIDVYKINELEKALTSNNPSIVFCEI